MRGLGIGLLMLAIACAACGARRRVTAGEAAPRAPIRPHEGTPGALAESGGGSEREIDTLVGTIGGSIAACANGRHGAVSIDVTYGADGQVRDEAIASGDFQGGAPIAGTLEAGCMLAVAHGTSITPFTGEDRHVTLPFHF